MKKRLPLAKVLFASFVFAAAQAQAELIVIDSGDVEGLSAQQTSSWIGASEENPIWALDFGTAYGPSANKVNFDDSYILSTSVLKEADIEVKKVTSGQYLTGDGLGSGYANATFVVDCDYQLNVLYSNGGYNLDDSGAFNPSTVSASGEVSGFALSFKADAAGDFSKLTITAQDFNTNGMAFILDFSNVEYAAGEVISGSCDIISSEKYFSYNGSNNIYYTLDGENFISIASNSNFTSDNVITLEDGSTFTLDLSDDSTNLNLSYSVNTVPEPSTYAAICGLLALAFAAYRRRN